VGPTDVLDAVAKKIYSPHRESNPRTPIVQPVAVDIIHRRMEGDLHNFYHSPNNATVIKPKLMKFEELVTRFGEMKNTYTFLVGKREGKGSLDHLGTGEMIGQS
jgi:hypothetical protein